MTTMETTISNNSDWNNMLSDQLFDFDDLFSSAFAFIHNNEYDQDPMSIREEYEEISSSSEIDQEQLQTSIIDNTSQEYQSSNLKCGVCGAPAYGYNFDQITCESCKAFFRRNALRDMSDLECRFTGSCVINIRTRRHCTYCRLKKCFDLKMRKDWIRTENEKELRQLKKLIKEQKKLNKTTNDSQSLINLPIVIRNRKRLMIKSRSQDLTIKPIHTQRLFGFNRNLSEEDQILLSNITNAYQLVADPVESSRRKKWTLPSTLIQFINEENIVYESLISFYKSVPQFNQLDIKDRVLLIKLNFNKIIHLHCIVINKFQEHPLIGYYMSQWVNADFHQRILRTYRCFDRFIQHPLVLKLALIVFIFSTNLSTPYDIDPLDDYTNKIDIRRIQDFYITVLWRYLNILYEEREAIRSMEIIMTQILHYQILMGILEEHLRQQPDSGTCSPLESCLFRLT